MQEQNKTEFIRNCATCAVAFCINENQSILNGKAVMMMASYLQTCKGLTPEERTAALGYAVDNFICFIGNK